MTNSKSKAVSLKATKRATKAPSEAVTVKPNGKTVAVNPIRAAVKAAIAKGRAAGQLGDGPFVVTKLAKDAGFDSLPLRPGSARHLIVAELFDKPKGLTRQQIADLIGDQTAQCIAGLCRYNFLQPAS